MKIVLLSTGGTIAMAKKDDQLMSSIKHDASYFAEQIPLPADDDLKVIDYSGLPSAGFDSSYASRLTDAIEAELVHNDGIIITHGTDTMEETAFYLELTIKSDKPVIFTGAMNTASQAGYDGISNLRDGLKVVKTGASYGKGILIVFNKDIISALHAVKSESERVNAFSSMQTGKMGSVNGDKVFYYYERKNHIKLDNKVRGRVSIIKLHYDIEKEFVEKAFSVSDIIVFECLGSGRIPPKLIPLIEEYSSHEKIVIFSTRACEGHLYDEYNFEGSYQYYLDRNIIMSPLSSIKSSILAKLCLGNNKGYKEIKDIFENFWD